MAFPPNRFPTGANNPLWQLALNLVPIHGVEPRSPDYETGVLAIILYRLGGEYRIRTYEPSFLDQLISSEPHSSTLPTRLGGHPRIRTEKRLVLNQTGMPIPIRCPWCAQWDSNPQTLVSQTSRYASSRHMRNVWRRV